MLIETALFTVESAGIIILYVFMYSHISCVRSLFSLALQLKGLCVCACARNTIYVLKLNYKDSQKNPSLTKMSPSWLYALRFVQPSTLQDNPNSAGQQIMSNPL